ncbi:MAG TPA: DUF1549 and DUF1553 domain-containing protein [Verrucomicrobiae bacterium]|nr:DUF1549 and DUF1553 domain-containing protein [Verrucomicrobiae bacterium]
MILRPGMWLFLVCVTAVSGASPDAAKHWAFIKPSPPPLPQVRNTSWPRNAIDYFVLARLEKERIAPSPEASHEILVRRLYLDLIGLPPDATANDTDEDLIERLLASPHHGERWARWWLDMARYADSNGYSIDAPRSIWKYREWVINALNRDLPFDQFVIDQLAGDLLPNATIAQKIATGFNRNTQINQEGGIDPEQFRVECVMDRVNTTATAFLGLTVACAQCHDHKYDPISQREYYQFFAFFNSTIEDGHGKGAPDGVLEIPGEVDVSGELEKEIEEAQGDLDRYLNTFGNALAKMEQAADPAKLKPAVREAIAIPFADRTLQQKRAAYAAFRPEDAEFKSRNAKLTRLEKKEAKPVTTLVMNELKEPRESVVFIKGDFTRRGEKVAPGVLRVLHSAPEPLQNRLDLARWLVDPTNPLLARVIVNRVWQQYFGRGLVETENDFGIQGSPPTHPELLDWLATEFLRTWSLKHIHRLIVSSATYRQSSKIRPELATVDPNNKLLARQNRLRLDAEVVRDVCLTASGLLNPKIGGPSVFPPQPAGVMTLGQVKRDWKPSTGAERYRRGMYTFFWRATPHPALTVFDTADGVSACTRRIRSNTPLQALTLLNDEAFYECAQALAKRVAHADDRMGYAFQLCVSRQPSAGERQRLADLLKETDWLTVGRVLLNLDETITRE